MPEEQKTFSIPKLKTAFYNERFTFLLISLLLYMFLSPFLKGFFNLRLLMNIFNTAVLLSAVYAVSHKKSDLIAVSLLALPSFICLWIAYYHREHEFFLAFSLIGILFTGYIIYIFLQFIFHSPRVNRNVISSALVVYLFLGILWCSMFTALEMIHPGSFNVQSDWIGKNPTVFIYFSFVTLTTLGYGDITPITTQASALAIFEAIVGQVYIAVLIARLVGMQTAQFLEQDNKK